MEQNLTIADLLTALLRRWKLIAIVSAVFSTLAVFVALSLPPVYSSTAKILVQSPNIPTDLARPVVTSNAAERLGFIQQQLMAQDNLLGMADRLNLFPNREGLTRARIVDAIRASTTFDSVEVRVGRRGPATVSAFTITYRHGDPRVAARVANEFVTMVLEQNIQTRGERAAETVEFFRGEVDRLTQRLAEMEREIAEFKRANKSRLPEDLLFRQNELVNLRQRRADLATREATLQEERRQLLAARDTGAEIPGLTLQLSPEEEELQRLENELVQKRAIYTEAHPDVILIQTRIAALQDEVQSHGGRGDASPGAARARQINQRVELLDTEIASITRDKAATAARIEELETSIEQTPQVEMALNALDRRYTTLKDQHQQAVRKERDAVIGERLEVDRQAERFELLEQARVPTDRDSPNRKMIALAGGVGSFGIALGLALLLELTNKTIRSARDMERQVGLLPIAVLPHIATEGEVRRKIWSRRIQAALLIVVAPTVLALIHFYYLPLDAIGRVILQKTGIDEGVRFIERLFGW